MKTIPLSNSPLFAIVDDADYDRCACFKWQLHPSGAVTRGASYRTVYLARELMSAPKGVLVDHADTNPLNNRRENLRFADKSQNAQNSNKRRCPCTSRFKGVSWDARRRKWRAYLNVRIHGRAVQRHLGRFHKEKEAAIAYDRAAAKTFGDFARPNFR